MHGRWAHTGHRIFAKRSSSLIGTGGNGMLGKRLTEPGRVLFTGLGLAALLLAAPRHAWAQG